MKLLRATTSLLLVAAVAAGCAAPGATVPASESPSATPSPTPTSEPSEAPSPSASAAATPVAAADPPPGIPQEVWEALLADLERRVGDPVPDPEVVSAEARTWSDGSLGCPEPGMVYTQALVDGFQIVVEVEGTEYDYRSDGRGARYCDEANAIEGGG